MTFYSVTASHRHSKNNLSKRLFHLILMYQNGPSWPSSYLTVLDLQDWVSQSHGSLRVIGSSLTWGTSENARMLELSWSLPTSASQSALYKWNKYSWKGHWKPKRGKSVYSLLDLVTKHLTNNTNLSLLHPGFYLYHTGTFLY